MISKLLKKFIRVQLVFIALFLLIFLGSSYKVYAASLSLLPSPSLVSVGNIISLKVYVNTENKTINNGEAVIQFPTDMLEVISVTKSSSIFPLWVEDPSFSNSIGQVTFNGGVPNPGYNGSNGYIATITFKAKKQGTASIIFTDGAIRANDGLGTDILTSKNSGVIQIGVPKTVEVPTPAIVASTTNNEKSTVPSKPVIISETHPDQNSWYSANTATFSWKIPSGVTKIETLLSKKADAVPTINYDNSVTQKTLNNLSDGVLYFHLRYFNSTGWSSIAHYKIQIDSTSPEAFNPTIRVDNNQNIIKLNAVDKTSGIDFYTIKIDNGSVIKVKNSELLNNEYTLPTQKSGSHDLLVTAYDKAGNSTQASLSFVSSVIPAPEISLSSKEIVVGDNVTIYGKTNYPNQKVEVSLAFNNMLDDDSTTEVKTPESPKKYIQTTNSDGTFSVATEKIKTSGLINIWAEIVFADNVKSQPSEVLYLKVKDTKVVSTTLALIYPLLVILVVSALFIIIIFMFYLGWHKFFGLRKKINKELEHTATEVHKAMILLKEELNEQLENLEKIKVDRSLNKKEELIFDEIKKNIDAIDNFIKKRLKN